MTTLKTIAKKHGMEILFHEKPSAASTVRAARQLLARQRAAAGDTPHENAQFLVFCAAVIKAVHKYSGLLRASVASATNDHRLGAKRGSARDQHDLPGRPARRRVEQLAKGPATSSFAFTGNRVEFRAPGSMQTVAAPMVTINTIMAEARWTTAPPRWRRRWRPAPTSTPPVQDLLREIITSHGAVVFNGDGYSEKWQLEAAERGLPNLRTSLDALRELVTDSAMELFETYQVFNHRRSSTR